ncbi:hypothetical protein [Limnohabitans sp. Jir72]|uniref:hypothetical protein n=1 Tax=Limnohabitans sp. Jir72 TaxID=1977909 RepID=UPI000D353781|nr:hypothetical protein [Limnohabitans sp. Jir72]PUE33734.1 hypothetical protein B9Z52_06370 [Limnohabitans sp. Jir72]
MKKNVIGLTFGLLAVVCGCSNALAVQETRLAVQAMHCAAIFSVLAQVFSNDPDKGPKFSKGVEVLTDVYLKEQPSPTDPGVRAVAAQRRSETVKELQTAWPANGAYLREDGVICGAWVEGFLGQGDRYQFIPVYPKVVPPHIRGQYQTLVDEAMNR